MKKLLLLFVICMLTSQIVFCANTSPEKKSAARKIMESNSYQYKTSIKISENFRFDHKFANYMKFRGLAYESDRQRMIAAIYTPASGANRNSEAIAALVIKFNDDEISKYKMLVQEYCKYNAFKFEKHDPQACSQARINSLF